MIEEGNRIIEEVAVIEEGNRIIEEVAVIPEDKMAESECLFCKIAGGKTETQIVYEDEFVSAFNDIHPKAPVHILVVPKRHISGLTKLTDSDGELIGRIYAAILKIAREKSIFECGFRVIVNSGADAGQIVDHLHFHILGGTKLGGKS